MNRTRIFGNGIQRMRRWARSAAGRAAMIEPGDFAGPRSRITASPLPNLEPLEPRTLLSVTIFSETFENPFPATGGWMVEDANAVGTPAYWGAVDAAFGGQGTHGGSGKGYVAGVGFEGSPENPQYVNSMSSRMSRSIDLSGYESASIEFWHRIASMEAGQDRARLYVDTTIVWEISLAAQPWSKTNLNLDAFLGGTHTFTFEFFSGPSGVAEGLYLDDILVVGDPLDDDPDDTFEQAAPLGAIPFDGEFHLEGLSISSPTDVDFYSFTVEAGEIRGFQIERADDSPLTPHLKLYDSNGTQLVEYTVVDPGQVFGTGFVPTHLDYTFSVAGTYYLGVSSIGNTSYNPRTGANDNIGSTWGDYRLSIDAGKDLDDTLSEATNLGPMPPSGEWIVPDQSISRGLDVDMFAITIDAGTTLDFRLINITGSHNPKLRFFDFQGVEIGATYFQKVWSHRFEAAGTYFLGVSTVQNLNYNPITGQMDVAGNQGGNYTLIVADRSQDRDDTISESRDLGVIPTNGSASSLHEILIDPDDVDMFAFTVVAGQTVGIDLDRIDDRGLTSLLRLFDGQGNQLVVGHTATGPFPEVSVYESYLEYTFESGGTYYLGVSGAGNLAYDPIVGDNDRSGASDDYGDSKGLYALHIVSVQDPDDSISEATDLGVIPFEVLISTPDLIIDRATDVDMFAFTVAAAQEIGFDIDPAEFSSPFPQNTSAFKIHLRLFSADGTQLAANQNGTGPLPENYGVKAYIQHKFAAAGTYFLSVSNSDNTEFDPITGDSDSYGQGIGDYRLIVQSVVDPDDAISEATDLGAVPANGAVTHAAQTISLGGDVDMIAFTAAPGQTIGFDIDRSAAQGISTFLRLFTATGQELMFNDTGYGPAPETSGATDPFFNYTFADGGVHYLGVSALDNRYYDPISGNGDASASSGGGYSLTLFDMPDPDDSIAESIHVGFIPTGGSITITDQFIIDAWDVDLFAFTVTAGQALGFDIDSMVGGSLNSFIRLFDSNGVELAMNNDQAGPPPETSAVDSYLEYTFSLDGTYYLGVSNRLNVRYNAVTGGDDDSANSSTGLTGGYSLSIVGISDPDDSLSEAVNIGGVAAGGSVVISAQSIVRPTDVTMIAFTANGGQTIGFDIDRIAGSGLDSFIRLFDSTGTELVSNNNDVGPSPEPSSNDSYLEYTFAVGGTYFLGISASGNNMYDPVTGAGDAIGSTTGGYTLIIYDVQPDPDNTISEAIELGLVPLGGSISRTGQTIDFRDVDMVAFTVIAGQTIGFDIDRTTGSLLDSYIRLFDIDGTNLKSNNDAVGPTPEKSGSESYFKYSFANSGTYYLAVSSSGNTIYNPLTGLGIISGTSTGGYDLILMDTEPDAVGNPESDPNDAISEAFDMGLIALNGSASRTNQSIFSLLDVDMFAFTVAAGQTIGFDLDLTPSSGLGGYLRLFDASGATLAVNGIGAGPSPEGAIFEPYLEFTFEVAGTYYLGVSSKGNESYNPVTGGSDLYGYTTGGYDLHINSINDADGTIGQAIPLGPIPAGGGTETGVATIDRGTDVNFYSFTISAGQTLDIDLDAAPGSNLASYLRLFNASGTLLAANDFAPGPLPETNALESYLRHTFAIGGTYYLGVSGYGNNTYHPITGVGGGGGILIGGYSLQIIDPNLAGDFNRDGSLDAGDITLIQTLAASGQYDSLYDLNRDGQITAADVDSLIRDHLQTEYGDADLDGQVSLGDLVILADNFDQPGGWAQGDFNGDGVVTIGDLVLLAANFTSSTPDPLSGEGDAADQSGDAGGSPDMLRQSPALEEEDEAEAGAPFADILEELAAGLRD